MTATGIGAAVRRKEDQRFITGKGNYTDDINRQGQTHAYFVRSPHAHARINGIDASAALAMPGVVSVLTGDDMAEDKIGGLICGWMVHSKDGSPMKAGPHPSLAQGKVRYAGDCVAVVIAESHAQAKDAAEAVAVDYEPLDAVVDGKAALLAGAPLVHDEIAHNTVFDWELGNLKETTDAFTRAAKVVSLDLTNNRLIPNAMEPRAAIGDYNSGTGIHTLYTTSQNPHVARLVLSAFIGIAPENKLRVIAPDVGGGFGSKIFIYAEETVCVWAARRVGRPVKWTGERSESFLSDAHGRDHHTHAALALDADGKILGLRVRTVANLGAYLSTFASSVPTYLYATLLSGQSSIPAIYAEVLGVYTHTAPVDAYRGAGRPEATYVVERIVEEASRQIGMDPAEFRRKNFIRSFPHQTPVIMAYDIGDYEASLNKALEIGDYSGFAARRSASEAKGKRRGIGFSTYIEACGIAPSAAVGSLGAGVGLWESAEVRVNPTGSVEVLTGSHSHGQGHETTFAQLVSERLGVPIENVEIVHGDTDKVQFGMGTYGSRSGAVGMSAIAKALDKVEAKAKKIAAHLMEAAAGDIEFRDGKFTVAGTDKSLSFPEVSLAAYVGHKFPTSEIEPGLKESAFYDPLNFTFPAGCHICEVEVDPDTGVVAIDEFVAVDDFGTVINPMIVEGQVHGGIAQGIGQALLEHGVYSDDGQLVTGSYNDYTMPRADNLPSFALGLTNTPCPSNPLGMKGCGEAGAIAAPPAVINAITDALKIKDFAMPATPERVWRAAQAARLAAESRRAPILAAALLAFAGGANAITFDFEATHPDPFDGTAKCQTPELTSYGGYVYEWPSKYDLVFSPWDYGQFIWRCERSGFLSFPSDFELKPAEKEAVAAFLKTKGSDPLKGLQLIDLARRMEEIYAVRETDEDFQAFLLRYMAWQLRADPEADAYRRKALVLHKKMLDGGKLSGFPLQETLFILGHYSFRFGDREAANAYFERIKTVEVKDEDTGETVKGSEYLEGLAAEVLAGQADDAVRFKSDTP